MVWIILTEKDTHKEVMIESDDVRIAQATKPQYTSTVHTVVCLKSGEHIAVKEKPSEIKEMIRSETMKWLKELEEVTPRKVEKLKQSFSKRPGL